MLDLEPWEPTLEQRERNRKMGKGDGNCLVCSRRMPMDDPRNAMVHFSTTGLLFLVDEDHEGDADDQGWFEVGSSCAKKLPKAYVAFPDKA